MALDHAIMISLAERPGTGYELGRQFATSLGHFWPATRQQIYRTLSRLHADGLITCRDVVQEGRPDKKIYTLSPAGEDALASWIDQPTTVTTLRDELGVKLRGAGHGDMARVLDDVRHHLEVHSGRLALYHHYARTQFPDAVVPTGQTLAPAQIPTGRRLHQYLVLRGGIRLEEAFVDWCNEVLTALSPEPAPTTASSAAPATTPEKSPT